MSPRLIAALLAVALLAPAARADPQQPATGTAGLALPDLPFGWFARPGVGSGDLWRVGQGGPTTYSYLPDRQPPSPRLGPLLFGPVRPSEPTGALGRSLAAAPTEKTYTVVESARRERLFQRPLPTAAVLFASALCGIGGFAWWRCQSRGDP